VLYAGTVTDSLGSGAGQLAAFTDGYSVAFVASGIGMLVAAAIAVFMIRGTKDQLMPPRSADQPVLVGAH
jgi:biopolymer transport protein ExbB/TolQ